ncbi:hypothetical protein Fmac_016406 [Flemingia macrophylla]|uniref:Uncharacterized protein n=1 Tax=Flemingia macrophylla TaxID=520843 RepID=A0ABD1MI51_9FABA
MVNNTIYSREELLIESIFSHSVPKIQKVAHYLRDRKHFAKHYSPRLVSIGPIHHGAKNLQPGEKYKLMWASMYLKRTKQDAQALYQKIASKIKQLKELFVDVVIGNVHDDEKLSWMLFVDGCALLQILDKGELDEPEELKVKVDQLVLVWQDVLLLENQLPYKVLQLLSGHENDAKLLETMKKFIVCHHLSPVRPTKKQDTGEDNALVEEGHTRVDIKNNDTLQGEVETPFHLLDQLHRNVLDDQDQKMEDTRSKQNTDDDCDMITYRNIKELRAAGIKMKANHSHKLRDISFSYPLLCLWEELRLPKIIVDYTTAPTYLNLIAYEMCPDFKNNYEICSFVAFMDSLIDHPDDVKELRSAGILYNVLGSDEEVEKLFNTIGTDLVHDRKIYSHVRCQIEKHYRSKCRTWIALGCHTYFATPWAITALFAAVLALVLTFIQAWFAVNPKK